MPWHGRNLEPIPESLDRGFQSGGILSEGDKRDRKGIHHRDLLVQTTSNFEKCQVYATWLRSQHLGLGPGESGLPSCHRSIRSPRRECQQEGQTSVYGLAKCQRAQPVAPLGNSPRFTSHCFRMLTTRALVGEDKGTNRTQEDEGGLNQGIF